MLPPLIELIPARAAARHDGPTDLHVLVRITPPQPEVHLLRPPINLGLVLDHSGSMASGGKMGHAREAAVFAVEQLLPTDRLSLTIFDDEVETLIANAPVTDKAAIVRTIRSIVPNGSTALHAGWAEGAKQVRGHLLTEGLNRVLLLSDGLANVGRTDPKAIADEVRAARIGDVSTSAMGVGDDYNEDLLQAMADAGDGNYYYVETPKQLLDIFQTELQGLMATIGRDVILTVEPRHGVEMADFLNDLETAPPDPAESGGPTHRRRLPNLIVGMPIPLVITLIVPPLTGVTELLRVRLSWSEPQVAERQAAAKTLIVPAVSEAEFAAMPEDASVVERVAILSAGRLKLQAGQAMDRGDLGETRAILGYTQALLACVPPSPELATELDQLDALYADLDAGAAGTMRKRAKDQRYRSTRGFKPGSPPPPKS